MNLYALIGYPLGHSFSKKYFTDKFEREGLEDCFFELFPIENIGLFEQLIDDHPDLKGLAVTIPYKQSVTTFLDEFSDEAVEIGAVNCIKFSGKRLIGYNTDAIGFEKSFSPLLQPHHAKALVLGTGGSSKAVTYILKKINIPFLLVSRTPKKEEIGYRNITKELLSEYTIIINCSPVGMTPNDDQKPDLPYQFITAKHYCYDLIYTPAETTFLRLAKENGAVVKNGYDMLVIQAEENWKIWNEEEK